MADRRNCQKGERHRRGLYKEHRSSQGTRETGKVSLEKQEGNRMSRIYKAKKKEKGVIINKEEPMKEG